MAQPAYGQFCALARALDVVGERWTLLIVRDLLLGPQRYTDLLTGLGGVSPNILAERLKKLEELGIVARRKLPPPAASTVYELTPLGRGLSPALTELMRWGMNFLTERRAGDVTRVELVLMALRMTADPQATVGIEESYEFRVEEHTFHVDAANGAVSIASGEAADPAVTITTDFETLAAIGAGAVAPEQALAEHRVELRGDPGAAVRVANLFKPHGSRGDRSAAMTGAG